MLLPVHCFTAIEMINYKFRGMVMWRKEFIEKRWSNTTLNEEITGSARFLILMEGDSARPFLCQTRDSEWSREYAAECERVLANMNRLKEITKKIVLIQGFHTADDSVFKTQACYYYAVKNLFSIVPELSHFSDTPLEYDVLSVSLQLCLSNLDSFLTIEVDLQCYDTICPSDNA